MDGPIDVRSASILVVDDLDADARLIQAMLQGAGYGAVAATTDPREVAKLHRRNRYDLIVLDLMMPGMDGFEVLEELKKVEPTGFLPVLVVTAEPDHMTRALSAGARDFMSKPVRMAELLPRVGNLLETRLLLKERRRTEAELKELLQDKAARLSESEELFRLFAKHIPLGLSIRGVDDKVYTFVNASMERILAVPLRAGEGIEKALEAYHPSDRPRIVEQIQRMPLGGLDEEVRLAPPGGEQRWAHLRTFPIADSKGDMRWIGGVMEDITDRKRLEEEAWRYAKRLETANTRLRFLSERVLDIQEAERRNISQELHDDVGQSLIALRIGLHRLGNHIPGEQARLFSECVDVIDGVQERLRELAVQLHPPQLEQLGLQDALRALVSRQKGMTGLEIGCACRDIERRRFPIAIEGACYRICQEALNNATQHARARRIEVTMKFGSGILELVVRDDGVGFDEQTGRGRMLVSGSMGLVSMEERARLAGGRLEIVTAPGKGTSIVARFPVRSTVSGAGQGLVAP